MNGAPKALAGKRIVLTRPAEDSADLLRKLEASGAKPILLPFIEFRPPEDSAPLDSALAHIADFDWIVFTSRNSVRFFCRRMKELRGTSVGLAAPHSKIAVIGAGTSRAAAVENLHVDLVTSDARSGREFVAEFCSSAAGKSVLLPQSDQAGAQIAEGLRKAATNVTTVVAYRTCMPESIDGEKLAVVRRDGADGFVFASPSAFCNFARIMGETDLKRFASCSAFAAIGPTTAQAIRRAGVPVAIEAAKPNSDEIIKAMIAHFSQLIEAKARR